MTKISRRALFLGPLVAAPALLGLQAAADTRAGTFRRSMQALERDHGGRLGAAVLDTARGTRLAYRGDERFPLCSTYKFLAAAFILARVDRREESLARRVAYAKADLVTHSPITEKHVGPGGMTLGEICAAALSVSDNTAGNLQLDSFGGPAGLTAYFRSLGDRVTRLDRRETALNEAAPGDPRDTTTPLAMLGLLHEMLLGTALSPASRRQLAAWMVGCQTGDKRLRAGAPPGWRVGDKTGTGEHNATNDVAIFWPPDRRPILITAFYIDAPGTDDDRGAVLAAVARLAAAI